MDEIAPGLRVSDESAASGATGIDTVVCLLHEPPEYREGDRVLDHPLVDGPQCDAADFASAVEAVRAARRREETVLVHCSAGTSRSVAVVATALAAEEGVDLADALARVAAAREGADPHPALVSLGQAYLERA
jgi:protein-tyrosine phosphatase